MPGIAERDAGEGGDALAAEAAGQWTAGYVMLVAAKELRAHGHPRDAREVAQRAVGWCRSRPEQERSTRDQRTGLAEALYSLGRWDEAQELYVALAEEDPDDLDSRGRLGAIAKGGSRPVVEVIEYSEPPSKRGLVIMNTPSAACESMTGLLGGGSQMIIFSTGRGNSIGSPELIGVWKDPDFDPNASAFYYARVIEIPTPRWTAYEAKRFGITMSPDVPMTTTERAYTSPIWYTPAG